jgi:hypothetical protein
VGTEGLELLNVPKEEESQSVSSSAKIMVSVLGEKGVVLLACADDTELTATLKH